MNRNRVVFCSVFLLAAVALIFSTWTLAQTSSVVSRITEAVDEARLVRLPGNTHPLARPEFDQGIAPPDLPMERIMLVLKRSPEQDAAAEQLAAEQLDKSSPNYHHWLTAAEYGQRFGPSDSDIQTITSWLSSHGFEINSVAKGRNVIEFSGNASQLNEALHTQIHRFIVNGEEHWANASDPQIPAALAPVVAGPLSLHNFHRIPMARRLGQFSRSKATGEVRPVNPNFTFDIGSPCGLNNNCFAVGPADFAAIYHVQDLWNVKPTAIDGTGQTIAIANDSNINIADAHNFRTLFGLPTNDPKVILAGTDPGKNGDEVEADIDTQWSGAVAKNATIDLVIAASTNASQGVDLAAQFIIQNHVAPILSESFGDCESALGAAGNLMFNNMWQQAAMSNITVLISTGDSGAAGCENPNPNLTTPQPAKTGAAISGIASTPFNTAVGGTDFNQFNLQANFWNTTPTTSATGQTQLTAKGYIPESVWNDSCTNMTFISAGFDPTIIAACNDKNVSPSFIVPVGGGGGISTIYSKPAWQTALTPGDGQRDVPDVSLFAGAGLVGSFYVICQQDANPDKSNAACDLNSPFMHFSAVGGTSVSTQAFAGIMALVLQKNSPGAGLGLINPTLYTLAGTPGNSCVSVANPAATCIFNDITTGTNSEPCELTPTAVAGCGQAITSQVIRPPNTTIFKVPIGIVALACIFSVGLLILGLRVQERNWRAVFALMAFAMLLTCAACGSGGGPSAGGGGNSTNGVLPGFNAAVGYDRATGLGTVNAFNLVNNW
ncbi:MAG TPA: S53 family peptidase [Candidatus Limnocylindria bacterium]|nr:S53 family peptidase [Candidatus Limnocylindria bacterium]